MTPSEMRHKETGELVAIGEELRRELFQLRMQHYTGQLDKVSRLKETRRDIARIETILRERQLSDSAE